MFSRVVEITAQIMSPAAQAELLAEYHRDERAILNDPDVYGTQEDQAIEHLCNHYAQFGTFGPDLVDWIVVRAFTARGAERKARRLSPDATTVTHDLRLAVSPPRLLRRLRPARHY